MKPTMDQLEMTNFWGHPVVPCSRCGRLLQVKPTRTLEARVLRASAEPITDGYCADCAITAFIKDRSQSMLADLMDRHGLEVLRALHIQQQWGRILRAGNADADASEIDWERVIANWDLPL